MGVVSYEIRGAVAWVTLNEPDRLNVIHPEFTRALIEHLESALSDPSVRVIVLTGAGKAFSAGGDLRRLAEPDTRPLDQAISDARELMRVTELLRLAHKPTIAAVNGACAGAGLSWACAADLRVAASTAVFAAAFLRAGRAGDYGLAWTLPRIVGDGRARKMLLLGERVDAVEAERIGLVSEVVEQGQLLERTQQIAGTVAELAAPAVEGLLRNLAEAMGSDLSEYLDQEADRHVRVGRSPEATEAVMAILEKRPPRFARTT